MRNGQIYRYIIYIFILSLLFHCLYCAIPKPNIHLKEDHVYGVIEGTWRGQWWDHYLRGLSYSKGNYADDAISDFKNALNRRFKDQRRVRTYGMHILNEYFPHRELGIVYYKTKQYEKAIYELKLSINQFESAKAKYFFNLATEEYLKETHLDIESPTISVNMPKNLYTNQSDIILEGYVIDDYYAKEIWINEELFPIDMVVPKIEFNKCVSLKEGKNFITIAAVDLVGHKTERVIEIVCDRKAPIIYLDKIELTESKVENSKIIKNYLIEGYLHDDTGIGQFQLNDHVVDMDEIVDGHFSVNISLYSYEKIDFYLEDNLKNITTGKIDMEEFCATSSMTQLAYAGKDLMQFVSNRREIEQDIKPPVIKFKNLPKALRVNWDEVYIEGEIRDEGTVTLLKINDFPLITRSSPRVFFNYHVKLNEGINVITFYAKDDNENIITEKIEIYREIQSIYKIGSRLRLALMPFKYIGQRDELGGLIYDQLIQKVIQQERFQLVDRDKIDLLLDKQGDSEYSSLEFGRLLSAEGVIVGRAYFYDDYLEIIARLIDTETSIVLASCDVFGPIDNLSDVMLLSKGLALKFKQEIPLAEGIVTSIDETNIQLNLKKSCGIKKHMKIIFYRMEEKDLRQIPVLLGEGRVEDICDEYSNAIISNNKDNIINLMVDDRVITK